MMKIIRNTLVITMSALTLGVLPGCATYDPYGIDGAATQYPYQSQQHPPMSFGWNLPELESFKYHSHKSIDDYSEQLAMQLVENLSFAKAADTVAVTSLVEMNSSLEQTNILGNHLSDGLMGELQQFGFSVIDFKTMDMIKVNSAGDFVYSRDHRKLRPAMDIDYVLSGTMTRSRHGVLVHARIVGMETKVVVSSAKILIPNFVIYSVYSSGFKDGIYFGS